MTNHPQSLFGARITHELLNLQLCRKAELPSWLTLKAIVMAQNPLNMLQDWMLLQ
jgi:hypothetical protein